jgi:hypothetical protein
VYTGKELPSIVQEETNVMFSPNVKNLGYPGYNDKKCPIFIGFVFIFVEGISEGSFGEKRSK